jgi:hypothetical protein
MRFEMYERGRIDLTVERMGTKKMSLQKILGRG